MNWKLIKRSRNSQLGLRIQPLTASLNLDITIGLSSFIFKGKCYTKDIDNSKNLSLKIHVNWLLRSIQRYTRSLTLSEDWGLHSPKVGACQILDLWKLKRHSKYYGIISGIIDSMDTSLNKLLETVEDREARHAAVHGGHKESDMTEQLDTTTLNIIIEHLKGRGWGTYGLSIANCRMQSYWSLLDSWEHIHNFRGKVGVGGPADCVDLKGLGFYS